MAARITAFRKRVWNDAPGAAGSKRESRDYRVPGAEHAFNADYRPSYHAESAKAAGSECWNGLHSMVLKSNAISLNLMIKLTQFQRFF